MIVFKIKYFTETILFCGLSDLCKLATNGFTTVLPP